MAGGGRGDVLHWLVLFFAYPEGGSGMYLGRLPWTAAISTLAALIGGSPHILQIYDTQPRPFWVGFLLNFFTFMSV